MKNRIRNQKVENEEIRLLPNLDIIMRRDRYNLVKMQKTVWERGQASGPLVNVAENTDIMLF